MARFDKTTIDFMEKLADEKQDEVSKPNLAPLRTLKSVVKSIQDPHKAIGKALVSGATMKALFEKEAKVKVLGVYGILNEHYGRSWWDWEPETVWQTLKKEHGFDPDEDLKNLISALQLCVSTNQPFENWHVFEKVGHAFNQNPVNFGIVQPLEPQETALTLKLLRAIRPKQDFASEICGYLAAVAKNAGLVYLPKEIFTAGCQDFLDGMGNDTALAAALAKGEETGGADYLIQKARLKEIEQYVADHFGKEL
jgi:hypothetical protein